MDDAVTRPPAEPRSEAEIRCRIRRYVESRADLRPEDFAHLSWPVLCVWRAVELTYDLEGVGPSGDRGFTLSDFLTNLDHRFPELALEYGTDFAHTLMELYVSMIEYLPGGRADAAAVAGRLDQAVDDLMRSDLPSVQLH